ncbi:hypothetical protein MNBD_PLANCTO03-1034 [hydrothermal vent metagenome]|uniref:Anti-sigma-28 factor FlgM C-terminal domain-containing protein n=1 Tax=hydrothermal vent metagenome TaxID=652676 RepID=A0A3B1DXE0_9ZZZZ
MTELGPIGGGASASGMSRPHLDPAARPGHDAEPKAARRGTDQVEVSNLARSMSRVNQEPPVRQDLIDRVRAEIDAGQYLTPERLDVALERMLDSIDPPA